MKQTIQCGEGYEGPIGFAKGLGFRVLGFRVGFRV